MAKVAEPWSARQQRHLSAVSKYTMDTRHVAGKDNPVADCLSCPGLFHGQGVVTPSTRQNDHLVHGCFFVIPSLWLDCSDLGLAQPRIHRDWHHRGSTLIGTTVGLPSLEPPWVHPHWHHRGSTLIGTTVGPPSLAPPWVHPHWHHRGSTLIGTTVGPPSLAPPWVHPRWHEWIELINSLCFVLTIVRVQDVMSPHVVPSKVNGFVSGSATAFPRHVRTEQSERCFDVTAAVENGRSPLDHTCVAARHRARLPCTAR
uniref:uncharacterized protein n=1 Tax=Myxine glutinosa TaxID=7769 RepID=UPI00358E47A6